MGLTYSSAVDANLDEVYDWHARPGAVTRLTPPWQPVRVLTEAGSLRDGRAVLGLPGGLRWGSRGFSRWGRETAMTSCGARPPAGVCSGDQNWLRLVERN